MNNWNDVLTKVNSPVARHECFLVKGDALQQSPCDQDAAMPTKHKSTKRKMYFLAGNLCGKYLTHQEAKCMLHILRGCTIVKTAQLMDLSDRTVESYLKNIKNKLGVKTKAQLICEIVKSGFVV